MKILVRLKVSHSKFLMQVFICLLSVFASIPAYSVMSFTTVDNIDLDSWDGSGGLEGFDDFCILSFVGASTARRYDVAAYGPNVPGSSNFALFNGTNHMPITYEFRRNTTTYVMTDYAVSGYITPLQPGTTNCSQANSNGRITMKVSAANLATAVPGIYTGAMGIDTLQQGSGVILYNFTLRIPELAQLNGLDTIGLGAWSGAGDLVGSDTFCVFRNGSGNFRLTATGSHDSGGTFNLDNAGASLPYVLEFRQGSGSYFAASPSTVLSSTTTSFSGGNSQNCGGSDNSEVRATIAESNLFSASVGGFTDTVTLLVEPE